MPLSRLDNFIKNVRGNILYVNPNDLDATDSIENQGNSLTRPFKTIQRALIESARFSWQAGSDNDRFGKTTILVYPGEHIIDNRPGWIPDGTVNGSVKFRLRGGTTSTNFSPLSLSSDFDLNSDDNILYKLNSIHGGVILPRGTSIVGLDLRKTTIRPKYVPNPENDNIERSAIFRLTGACYLWQFTIFDANPNNSVYKDYTSNTFVPNFSHHKLTAFEYADGVNGVSINDEFQTYSTDRTDLDMYYEKLGLVYGPSSGREIQPDYPSTAIDIQPKVDEYRIVGPANGSVGISTIIAGDGITANTTVTVTTEEELFGIDVDTAIRIDGVTPLNAGYNGEFVVSKLISATQFQYKVSNPPSVASINPINASVNLTTDTVSSASPYVFNISLRSVYGMCGLHADGDKATGFKSMVVAQFTGIGLQKDKNAFVKYNTSSSIYEGTESSANANINTDSLAVYKPSYENYHIKCSNGSILQLVSVFAIGFAQHFLAESGGDQSVTNSNSNFGAKSLVASGYRKDAFQRDDVGYITHIIPPRELDPREVTVEFTAIDVGVTTSASAGAATTTRLYLYGEVNIDNPPNNVLDGYRIGTKQNETLNVLITQSGTTQEYSSRIVMTHNGVGITSSSSEKSAVVTNNSNSILSFAANHSFIAGEIVRILSDNGQLPNGIENNKIYYAITSGVSANQIKLAQTFNDSINATPVAITFNNVGGNLTVVSRVSDKNSGDIGHPIQFDSNRDQWYINVAAASTENGIYSRIRALGTNLLGDATSRTYIKRTPDNRSLTDTIYRLRYCIPAGSGITTARPPIDGFIIQESTNIGGYTDAEVDKYFSVTTKTLNNTGELRNPKFIANASWSSGTATITSELPHGLRVGSEVKIENVLPTGYNGTYKVTSVPSAKQFTYSIETNPGTFANNTSNRTSDLPRFSSKKYKGTYYVYRSRQIQEYIPNKQDGVYHLYVLNSSNSPNVTPFNELKFSQPVQNLYPQTNRDNPLSDPKPAISFALPNPIGQVVVDNPQNSITKETINSSLLDTTTGVGITDIASSSGTVHTIHTATDHGLRRITKVSIVSGGSAYFNNTGNDLTYYNANLVGFAGSTTGSNATARVTVNSSGAITNVKIMDGGSAYGIGNTLAVVGIATTTGHVRGVVSVTSIYDNVGDTLVVDGIRSKTYDNYNEVYRITGVSVGSSKRITVQSTKTLSQISGSGIGASVTANAVAYVSGKSLSVSALSYNNVTGLGTVTTSDYHGLRVGNKVRLEGASNNFYNDDFVITKVGSVASKTFTINVGISTNTPTISGTIRAHKPWYSSQGGSIDIDNDKNSARLVTKYGNVTTNLQSPIITTTTDSITLTNIHDINIGDYLQIDDEILRVKETPSAVSNVLKVFRGLFGTLATTHVVNSVVKRIQCDPIEFRRNSIIRASGHTFEYVGFGPGNYSTALPDRQDRKISAQEELLAQSTKVDGGINVFTGMNNDGDFYVGNKKVNSATGQEEVFDSPVPTVTGEELGPGVDVGFDVLTPLEVSISRSIRVEGGPDRNIISEFDGPVIFNEKITSNSSDGIEAQSLYLQGDAKVSRKYTVGSTKPTLAGNPGDITYNENPVKGGYLGWIYSTDNDWYRFGNISISDTSNILIVDQLGVSTSSPGNCKLRVGSGSSLFCVDATGVGIGTTANQFKLNVNGTANISQNLNVGGTLNATYLVGDGSGITNLNVSSSGWTQITGGIYNTDLNKVGIGTVDPRYLLEVGSTTESGTDLYVNNSSIFDGLVTANSGMNVSGMLTSTSFRLNSTSGTIRAGIITTGTGVVTSKFSVGTALTVTSTGRIGLNNSSPSELLDVNGRAKFKSYYETVSALSVGSGNCNIDMSEAQTFTITPTENVTRFTIQNAPPTENATSFTIIVRQGSTPRTVAIDSFFTTSGSSVVRWASGVVPTVTNVANAVDVYSFMTIDGGATLYGVVGGQNFS